MKKLIKHIKDDPGIFLLELAIDILFLVILFMLIAFVTKWMGAYA